MLLDLEQNQTTDLYRPDCTQRPGRRRYAETEKQARRGKNEGDADKRNVKTKNFRKISNMFAATREREHVWRISFSCIATDE